MCWAPRWESACARSRRGGNYALRAPTEPTLPPSDRLHWPSAVIAALVTAAVVNVVQFPALELDMSDWYEAVRTKPGHELPDLIDEHFDSTQARFELYLQIRDLAPNATVTVPAESEVIGEHLLGLATAVEVVRSDAPASIDAAVAAALEPSVVAAGHDRDVGDYVIALPADARVEQLVLVRGPNRAWVVEAGLLDAARGGA